MKGLYMGKDFLSPDEKATDLAHWGMSYKLFPSGSNWEGHFSMRVNNTWIQLHSDNRHQDTNLEQFAKKLQTLKQHILEFKAHVANGKPEKPFNKRTWLNGEDKGDYYFTGFVAYAIGGEIDFGAALSIADCNRVIIFRFEMVNDRQKKLYGRIAENWGKQDDINMAILDKIVTMIDQYEEKRHLLIAEFVESLIALDDKQSKKRKKK